MKHILNNFIKFLGQIKIHILIFIGLAFYLLFANSIYTTFFLRNGRPIENPPSLPPDSSELVVKVDYLENIVYEGEDQYALHGYVLSPNDPESPQYEKILVLHSTSRNLFYKADLLFRGNINKELPQITFKTDNGGFRAIVSKNTLPIDNYRIGFLLVSKDGSTKIFHLANTYIQRDPNQLRIINGQ